MSATTPPPDARALMARAVLELRELRERNRHLENAAHAPVAIVGMSCRFPGGANSAEAFRQLLWQGVDAIEVVPPDRWDAEALVDPDPDAEGKVVSPYGGFVGDVARFDAEFFGISPREAESMDPQHRLLLETAWHALEHANMPAAKLRGSATGVFTGICTYDYAIRHLAAGGNVSPHFGTGNALSAAAGRLSYLLGFNGPAMSIDTACSSSLVAVHLACQSLRSGESTAALAGGVNLILGPHANIGFSRAHMLAPDGRCKPFDAAADGYVRSEGCGIVVLKLLADAERDGDPILAVIRGTAINQDGASSGLTVPSGPAQQDVVRKALADARVAPEDVAYVETHGTGTALGDPIEARSLGAVYGAQRDSGKPLLIGSVKSNIGHLEGAAGVASLIKAVLALGRGEIPPSLHFGEPNPNIDLAGSKLGVVTTVRPWPEAKRIAGVSSFGFTGTNAHVIVEAAPRAASRDAAGKSPGVVAVSARDPEALERITERYRVTLAAADAATFADLASAAALGREHFRHRRALLVPGAGSAAQELARRYEAGERIDWGALCDATARTRAHLPEYPFGGARHWLEVEDRLGSDPGLWVEGSDPGLRLDPSDFADHRVFGHTVVPAAAIVAMLLSAARNAVGDAGVGLEEVEITRPLVLDDGEAVRAKTTLAKTADGISAELRAKGDRIATARVMTILPGVPAPFALGDGEAMDAAALYAECARRGLDYGAAYRTIRQLRRHADGVVAQLALERATDEALAPALLDGGLQAGAVAYPPPADGALYVPVSMRRCVVFASAGATVECRLRIVHADAARVELDLQLLSGDRLVAFAEGVSLVAVDARAFESQGEPKHIERLVQRWVTETLTNADDAEVLDFTTASLQDLPQRLLSLRDALARTHGRPLRVLTCHPEAVSALVRSAQAAERVEIVCDGKRCACHLEPVETAAAPAARSFDAQRSYLITGGLGAVGLHIARWLVDRGARSLVLAGRTAPQASHAAALAALRARAHVEVVQADVADAAQLEALFARVPIAAIFHAAGVNRDATLESLTAEHFAAVWRAKVLGTRALLEVARRHQVGGFVAISSIAATYGAPGQANYAAANAAMEALVAQARAQGLAAQSIAFGPWAATGMAGRLGRASRGALEEQGLAFMSPQAALRELGSFWDSGEPHRIVHATQPKAAAEPASDLPPLEAVRAAAAAVLRASPASLDVEAPLVTLGLDSLMALELRARCRERFGIDIPTVDLVGGISVAGIVARLGSARDPAPPTPASTEPAELPLTQGQRALWYLHQLQPASPAYNIGFAVRVRSTVDEDALRQRIAAIVARHPQLSRVYRETATGLVQQLPERAPDIFTRHQVTSIDDAGLHARVTAAYREPFDLAQGPVARCVLFTRARDDHVLLIAIHHIAADAWSLWRLMEELRGTPAAPAYRFVDHVADEENYLRGSAARESLAYWSRELGGELPILGLPTDRPRPAVQALEGASIPLSLDRDDHLRLQRLARREGTTTYGVLLAAFTVLLRRYSRQDDIVVGCPTAGRVRPEARDTVGYFVNPVAVRARFNGGESFREHLRATRARLLDAMAHAEVPFPRVVEHLGAARHAGHSPVFQAAFVMQQLEDATGFGALLAPADPPVQVQWGELRLEHYLLPQQEGQFDLTLEMVQAHDTCHGLLKYNTDLWDAAAIARMARHLRVLLAAALDDPDQAIDALELLPRDEAETIQRLSHGPRRGYDLERPLHRWIEAQVERTPDAIALELDRHTITYAELNARANALARMLQGAGLAHGGAVPVCAQRGMELVVALLASLKAGGAYVPFDATHPIDRLRRMLADTGAGVILATRSTHAVATRLADGARVITVDATRVPTAGEAANLEVQCSGDSPSYTIFTSGSTGLPKGATNLHRGVVNRLCWMQEAFALDASDRVLQKTPFTFDVSVWEFFWPLMTGARLVLAQPDGHRDNAYLASLVRAAGITTLHFVPPMLQAFLDEPEVGRCTSLRRVICSGQELPATLRQRFFARLPHAELHNLYGPTECAVDVTWHRCAPGDTRAFVPIGAPIANTAIHVLDARGHPTPLGVPGEIHIAGVQVGRGYLQRPELTAERFVADPFAAPGATMYRTGDLGRYLPDGEVEFLGRNDFQVKIRGLRVELGEIEHALASLPGIREAVVLLREDAPAAARLVAYVVGKGPTRPTDEEISRALGASLPAYMVPEAVVWLEALPLGSSGKVDRGALPAPAAQRTASRAPQGAAEQRLASIWREVLAVERIGAEDNFFSLGGDSIALARMVSRARAAGFAVTVRDALVQPTVAMLALRAGATVPAPIVNDGGDIPLLPLQRWLLARDASDRDFTQAVELRATNPIDVDAMRAALADVVARHDALRLRFEQTAHGWTQTVADTAANLAIDIRPDRVVLSANHLVIDGVSWRTLAADADHAYRARLAGRAPSFAEPAASFAAWARASAAFAATPLAESEALYWLTEDWQRDFAVLPQAALDLGRDAIETRFAVEVREAGVSTYAMQARLLATLAEALSDADRPRDLRVDIEGHGREPLDGIEGSAVVGWCTALFPVALHLEGGTAAERAAAVERSLAEIPGGGRAYALCRDFSRNARLARALAAIPRAAILFNYLGRLDATPARDAALILALPDPAPARRDAPAYPLEVNAVEREGRLHLSLRTAPAARAWAEALATRWSRRLEAASDEPYPLTLAQKGILFHALLEPESGAYVQQLVVRFASTPDLDGLRAAFESVLERHAVLRNALRWKGLDTPVQQAVDGVAMPWQVHDWRDQATEAFDVALEAALAADRRAGLDLMRAPLHRVQVFAASGSCTLVWTHHHILLDGRSMFAVLNEVVEIARARTAGRKPALPAPIDFRAFAASRSAAAPATELEYWRGELSAFAAKTEVPFLRRAAPDVAYRAEETARSLTTAQTDALRRMARDNAVTLNVLLQSLLALHLGRLAGAERVLLGATRSADPGEAGAIGMYIDTIPVAVGLPADQTLTHWLQEQMRAQAERTAHDKAGLADIQRTSRMGAGETLFDLLLSFGNYPIDAALKRSDTGLAVQGVRVVEQPNYPLMLSVAPGEALELHLHYDAQRYPAPAAAAFLAGFAALLETATHAAPDAQLAVLLRASPAEVAMLARQWDATRAEFPRTATIDALFGDAARRSPQRVAIRDQGRSTTYTALEARARQIASSLAARGIGRGDVVGVCVGRDAEAIAALLGILCAGAAYMPLDSAFPVERLAYMLEDSGAAITLIDASIDAAIRARLERHAPLLALASIGAAQATPAAGHAQPEDLAYVLYTSGSTGKPKGVMVPHRAVVNVLAHLARDPGQSRSGTGPGLEAHDVMLALTTFAFDISVLEVFLTLTTGATLVMANPAMDPKGIAQLIEQEKVSVMQATPTTYRLLIEAGWQGQRGLRALCGGEALARDLSRAILERCDRLWNLYGPTETTVWSAACEIDASVLDNDGWEPIGRPFANTRAYILDAQLAPLPPGAAGELFIGGEGVTRGYRNNPQLTAERFLADPFGHPNARMYRTGDRARLRPDGMLDYLGRLDHQVKLRGFRIELGEIEAVLGAHAAVAHAVVMLREDRAGDPRLVAYAVTRTSVEDTELRAHLRRQLPEYMVPAQFVRLARLPMTGSGKVDRNALPAPDTVAAHPRSETAAAPALPIERDLQAIFSEVLGQARMPLDESFFDLGGHSLHLIQVQGRIARALGVEVPLPDFFRHPTLRGLATLIAAMQRGTAPEPHAARDRASERLTREDAREQQRDSRRQSRMRKPVA